MSNHEGETLEYGENVEWRVLGGRVGLHGQGIPYCMTHNQDLQIVGDPYRPPQPEVRRCPYVMGCDSRVERVKK